MAEKACRNNHTIALRYRKPDGHLSCRGCERTRSAKYRWAYPDRIQASSQKYIANHRELVRLRMRSYVAVHAAGKAAARAEVRRKVLTTLGSVCVRCGFSDPRALQIDHILGGGSRERRLGAKKMNLKILANSSGYQLLCANCNSIKKHENHEVPQPRLARLVA